MQPVIYDVAVSADGFISVPLDDVSLFPYTGPVVDDYRNRLLTYKYCIMGRRTYEFGYGFGLKPGENPYPEMTTYVISSSLTLPLNSDVEILADGLIAHLNILKTTGDGPVYLCGGGELAGWLIAHNAIDLLRLKRAPVFLGEGTRLFGNHRQSMAPAPISTKQYEAGILFQEFDLTDQGGSEP